MSSTQVVFKPGGVAALVVVFATIIIVSLVGLRGRNASSTSGAAVGAVAVTPVVDDVPITGPELEERKFLANLDATPGQKRNWLFLGPLLSGSNITNVENTKDDEAKMREIIGTSYLPTEAKYKAHENLPVTVNNATYRWRKVTGSAFDFKDMYASKTMPRSAMTNVVVYGYTTIESKGATEKRLRFRSDDGAIVWINGQQVYMGNKIRGVEIEDVIPVQLRPGRNNVLVKVGQGNGGWGMSFQVEDAPEK
ncbi:MAG: hypothetical protein H8F28_13435 [Fibrella sp.]|nr:hypothetical protein [Armatimonadota bacterium]